MALKKSELYSSLWSSCDELRGGMDARQYKDYVLVLLFIKYVSDKYAGQPFAPITIPPGASFKDMVALKGKSDIGDQINKKIIGPLANANKLSDMPDFNDANKLGSGKEMVERLTNLIAIFENKALDFSRNRAEGDDILGDAYEYLMRHFATESGKSKGQFYTPAEVSRIMAQISGIRGAKTSAATTVYDPTCGSGSLLLKVGDEAGTAVTLYGQEKDAATSGLARMNMILHDNPTALIVQGNTLADPKFKDGQGDNDSLKTFDYVVANPPFSDKRWSTGLDPLHDPYQRFQPFGTPPAKQGDYAYLLHIVRSLKSTGKGIFLCDASGGFMKDGPKNRLRAQDIHKIVDVFNKGLEIPKYSRMVSVEEIEKNEFNLNLPRYIDSQTPEDVQDIEGHLKGGIPAADVEALKPYWDICPNLKSALFSPRPLAGEHPEGHKGQGERAGYLDLAVEKPAIKSTIYEHPEFAAFIAGMNAHFAVWRDQSAATLKALQPGCHPKEIIGSLSESLLGHYQGKPLIDPYDIYQHLLDYWAETLQDDCYLIAAPIDNGGGWKAETTRIIETDKKGREKDRGWTCDLIPKPLIVARYYAKEQADVDQLAAGLESVTARLAELEEEHGGEEGAFAELDKVNKANVAARLKELQGDGKTRSSSSFPRRRESSTSNNLDARFHGHDGVAMVAETTAPYGDDSATEVEALLTWLKLNAEEADLKKRLKDAEADLDASAYAHYPKLTEAEIKALVVDDKWLAALDAAIHGEMDRVSQQLTQRVKELAERYETPLPRMTNRVAELVTWKGWVSHGESLQPRYSPSPIHTLEDVRLFTSREVFLDDMCSQPGMPVWQH